MQNDDSIHELTTLKQELSGESGEENRKSQLTWLVAASGICSFAPEGLVQSGFIWKYKKMTKLQLSTGFFKIQ